MSDFTPTVNTARSRKNWSAGAWNWPPKISVFLLENLCFSRTKFCFISRYFLLFYLELKYFWFGLNNNRNFLIKVVNKASTKICLIKIQKIWALKQKFNQHYIKKAPILRQIKQHIISPQKFLFLGPKFSGAMFPGSPISAVAYRMSN